MILKVTSKRQVTFPRWVLEKLHLRAGDAVELAETSDGFLLRPHRFDESRLAPLRSLIVSDPGLPDIEKTRDAAAADPRLRD